MKTAEAKTGGGSRVNPWATIDKAKKEHQALLSWLYAAHGAWTLQEPSADGCYVARRRGTAQRAPKEVRGKTVLELQAAILADEEARP